MSDIGQLIITGIDGLEMSEEETSFIESENIGGVLLFSRNYDSPSQLAELVNSIQVLRKEYPLFICVDHEGGRVIRFKKDFTQFPSMMELAKLESPKFCFHAHKIMATELGACGVNVNLTPCCDVLTNTSNKVIGDRSFGSDGESVAKYVSSVIRGLQTNGILSCAKHFPGHGSTSKDSHKDLPIINTPLEELKANEFVPFVKAVKSRVEFFMMGHLVLDAIDPTLPCSLSKKCHDFVREEFKYNKIIISDDMQMDAILKNYTIEEASVMALQAGTDMLEFRDMQNAKKALDAIKDAMKTKVLSNAEIAEKLSRVQDCKSANLSEYSPIYVPGAGKKINERASQILLADLESKIADRNS